MKEEKQKIHSLVIFEIIGKPPKHLVDSLNNIIDRIGLEEGVNVKRREIKEPKKMEEKAGVANATGSDVKIEESEFYITFAEVELETDNIPVLVNLIFNYMPAHIEIISPENISLTNGEWGDLLTALMQKLHAYDEVARVMQVEKAVLEDRLRKALESKIKKGENKKPKKTAKKKSR